MMSVSRPDLPAEADVRPLLADYFRRKAAWRRRQAERWAGERERCLRSAAALDELAAYILGLPPSDRLHRALVWYGDFDAGGQLAYGGADHQRLKRFRRLARSFRYADARAAESCRKFLYRLLQVARDEFFATPEGRRYLAEHQAAGPRGAA
jgi:hypothetical protein